MPKSMSDPILTALRAYGRDPDSNGKRAVLLTPQGGYFLYGSRFCGIADYELTYRSSASQIEGASVGSALFFGKIQGMFHAAGEKAGIPEHLSLLFHIDLGEGELLRGAMLAAGQEVQLALFCDEAVEKLYRLACRIQAGNNAQAGSPVPPDDGLRQYAESLRRNDLHALTGLYLRSRPVKPGFVENL